MSLVPAYLRRGFRGGSWIVGAWFAYGAYRNAVKPSEHGYGLGFRLLRRAS